MNEPVRRKRAVFDWSAAVIMILSIGSAILVFVREGSARFLSILTDDLELISPSRSQRAVYVRWQQSKSAPGADFFRRRHQPRRGLSW